MSNEYNLTKEKEFKDYRIILYRLDTIEREQKENFKELMKMIQVLQEGQNNQNEKLIELTQRQQVVEQKIQCIDKLKEVITKHGEAIRTHDHRINIYKQVLMGTGIGVIAALLMEIIKYIH